MDKPTFDFIKKLEQANVSADHIEKLLHSLDDQIHVRIIEELLGEGYKLEEAELLYRQARAVVEAEDHSIILDSIEADKQRVARKKNRRRR